MDRSKWLDMAPDPPDRGLNSYDAFISHIAARIGHGRSRSSKRSRRPAGSHSSISTSSFLARLCRHLSASRVQSSYPKSLRARQLEGLALRRIGRFSEAIAVLSKVKAAGHQDPETLGILAAAYNGLHRTSGKTVHLRRSRGVSNNVPSLASRLLHRYQCRHEILGPKLRHRW